DVQSAAELVSKTARARPGRPGAELVGPLQHQHRTRPRGRQMVGGAGPDHAPAHDHDVRRVGHRCIRSNAAFATTRSSNATPTDLKIVMSSGEVRTAAPLTTSERSATMAEGPITPAF